MQNDATQNITTENKPMSTKMTIVLVILGIILLPVLLTVIIAKSKKLKKPVKAGLIAAIWIFTLAVGAANSDNTSPPVIDETPSYFTEDVTDDSFAQFDTTKQDTDEPATISVFEAIENPFVGIEVGEKEDFSIVIMRNDITSDSIIFENSDATAVAIENIAVSNNEQNSILTFTCSALASGSANIRAYIPSEDIYSDYIFVTAKITPKVESFGFVTTYTQYMEEDESKTYTIELTPGTVKKEDFEFVISDTNVINVFDVIITNEETKTIASFSVYANSIGSATLQLKAVDGLTESKEMSFEIKEKDTSPTVYTTPYGEKYHYSEECAGSNAIEKTLNKAIEQGFDPCSKCVY